MIEQGDYAEVGDLTAYNYLLEVLNQDLSDESNFDQVRELINIENYTDFVIMQVFSVNTSVNHNTMAWKPKENGKWQWIVVDVDRGFITDELPYYEIEWFINQQNLLLNRMITNEDYKNYFIKRFSDHLYTTFSVDRVSKIIADYKEVIDKEMPRYIARWQGTTSNYGSGLPSYQQWLDELGIINEFVLNRRTVLWDFFERFGFSAGVELGIGVYPEDAGTVTLNGMPVETNEALSRYLESAAFNLEATPQLGFEFVGWSRSSGGDIIDSKTNIEVIATENINYYAVFEANEVCLISPLIDETTVLNKECSPYYMNTDVWIKE